MPTLDWQIARGQVPVTPATHTAAGCAPWLHLFDAAATAARLSYPKLVHTIERLLRDPSVVIPPRVVLRFSQGGSLFTMPARCDKLAITKLITFVPDNPSRGLPAIQGDVVVFDATTGTRIAILDGPTVTARRTAAVSALAALKLASWRDAPLLVVGAGVQGAAHVEAYAQCLGIREVWVHSRTTASANALVDHARTLGLRAQCASDVDEAVAHCPLVVTATTATQIAVRAMPRPDAFVAAVGAFNPTMHEWAPDVCRRIAAEGRIVVDTRDADHEAGDLIGAGIDVAPLATLADVVTRSAVGLPHCDSRATGPVFFKSCGSALWDLAAALCVVESASAVSESTPADAAAVHPRPIS